MSGNTVFSVIFARVENLAIVGGNQLLFFPLVHWASDTRVLLVRRGFHLSIYVPLETSNVVHFYTLGLLTLQTRH